MVPQQSTEFPKRGPDLDLSEATSSCIYNCVFDYFLIREYISEWVWWYGVQVLGQDVTEF